MRFSGSSAKYLSEPNQKIDLFLGLGSDYAPKLDPLRKAKRLLIVENCSDSRMLQIWARRIGITWPKNLVEWPWNAGQAERKQLFLQLQIEIPELRALSLRDRDNMDLGQVDQETLRDKSTHSPDKNMMLRVWRRRHIENYVLLPAAIARASGRDIAEVVASMADRALTVPANFAARDVATAMLDARGKEITQEGATSIKARYAVSPEDIANAMEPDEVPDDVKTLLGQIVQMCAD
jgi:hypothetical protein